MKNNFITESLKWKCRNINKDSILVLDKKNFSVYVLFDGVSSSINAKQWINIVKNYITKNIENYYSNGITLWKIFFDANNYLLNKNIVDSYTTCSCLYIEKNTWKKKILNIWDSRIYFITNQYKKQLTLDDKEFENSNEITKCLWMNLHSEDIKEVDLDMDSYNNGNFLLCSDWFYTFLENNKLLFHKILQYKRLLNIKNNLYKQIKGKNIDDSTYIYIINNKNV